MPIPTTIRVNPLDLRKNIAIGVSLPFNGPSGPFNSIYSTADQIKSNLINLILTNKGERIFNPEFGLGLRNILFEGLTDDIIPIIQDLIVTGTNMFIPEIIIIETIVDLSKDNNKISITVNYRLRISGTADQITVQFI
jgi:phage baseplate assembly protein W